MPPASEHERPRSDARRARRDRPRDGSERRGSLALGRHLGSCADRRLVLRLSQLQRGIRDVVKPRLGVALQAAAKQTA